MRSTGIGHGEKRTIQKQSAEVLDGFDVKFKGERMESRKTCRFLLVWLECSSTFHHDREAGRPLVWGWRLGNSLVDTQSSLGRQKAMSSRQVPVSSEHLERSVMEK